MTSREQQLAEAIMREMVGCKCVTPARATSERIAAAVEPFLVAAERAGYERCKRDAATRIEHLRDHATHCWELEEGEARIEWGSTATALGDAIAVVAALNATHEEADAVAYAPPHPQGGDNASQEGEDA